MIGYWIDIHGKEPTEKLIMDAIASYKERHGKPNCVWVHKDLMVGDVGIDVLPKSKLMNLILIGVQGET